jgi:hypothetical protein
LQVVLNFAPVSHFFGAMGRHHGDVVAVAMDHAAGINRHAGAASLSGLAVDAKGGVWTALQDGWSVVRFSPDGNQDRVIGLPVLCPGGCSASRRRNKQRRAPPRDHSEKENPAEVGYGRSAFGVLPGSRWHRRRDA